MIASTDLRAQHQNKSRTWQQHWVVWLWEYFTCLTARSAIHYATLECLELCDCEALCPARSVPGQRDIWSYMPHRLNKSLVLCSGGTHWVSGCGLFLFQREHVSLPMYNSDVFSFEHAAASLANVATRTVVKDACAQRWFLNAFGGIARV